MAPKRRSAAQPPPSLLGLPPEVLQLILADVPLADRLSRVALACKQLHALCLAPALIAEVDTRITGPAVAARVESLLRFLARRGEHARSLWLRIQLPEDDDDEAGYGDVASLAAACIAACGARQQVQPGGGLRTLAISAATPLQSLGCVLLLTALEELHLCGRNSNLEVRLDSSWRQLTALQRAQLSSRLECRGTGPCLPPSLQLLCIEGDWQGVPEEDEDGGPVLQHLDARVLAGLPALDTLALYNTAYESSSLAAVSGLTALTMLALYNAAQLPPAQALAALAPSLRTLELQGAVLGADIDRLELALQALTALRTLMLAFEWFGGEEAERLSPDLSHMTELRHVALSFYSTEPGAWHGGWPDHLPALPWASLRWLALPLEAALGLHAFMANARQLETLCLLLPGAGGELDAWLASGAWPAVWHSIATHPPLRCLLYEVPANSPPFSYQLLDALLQQQQQRPALEVRRLVGPAHRAGRPSCWAEVSD